MPMDEIVRKDALQILNQVIDILRVKEEKDVIELKDLSNHTIHNASVFQDETSVSIAVLVYALSKIIERKQNELNYTNILKFLETAREHLQNNEEYNFNLIIKKLFSEILRIDSKLKLYIQEVINQAQIKKGFQLYKHGLSCAKASEILGISQWELMNYIGKTKLNEDIPDIVDVRTRLKFARGLFS